ncbi:helix-turn-helix domain-containing protein [Siccibacter colletis]|uniref:helix-turn-helix domain-containing protein n=1 Tax=Siccibacter colletis TaxID=1505757 RepID=UPI003CEDC6FE
MTTQTQSLMAMKKSQNTYADDLIEKLSEYLTFRTYPARSRFTFSGHNKQRCYLFRSGQISGFYKETRIQIDRINTPWIAGVAFPDQELLELMFVAETECEVATLTQDEVMALIQKTDSWQLYAGFLQVLSTKLLIHMSQVAAPDTFSMVCNQLLELINEPDAIRTSIKVEEYVRSRTQLSRSGVFKVLSRLKEVNAIVIEKGMLVAVNELPDKMP